MISFKRCNICNHRCIDSRVQQRHPQREFVANVFQPCRDQRAAPVLSGLYAREIFYFSLYVLNESRNARLSALTTSRSARKVVCNATTFEILKERKKEEERKGCTIDLSLLELLATTSSRFDIARFDIFIFPISMAISFSSCTFRNI